MNIDIDHPGGVYKSYPPSDSDDTIPFACGGAGTQTTHHYYLQTVGGTGPMATREITVSASS
ncbi:MAG: hypothetical protein WCB85_10680 [Candidatus Dormiibacterota bacterium]